MIDCKDRRPLPYNGYRSKNLLKYRNPIRKLPINIFLKMLSRLVNSLSVNKILDIGCGEGIVAKYLISHNKNLVIEGIDINDEAIALARQLCPEAIFRKRDVSNNTIDYLDKSFDLVLAIEILEHLVKPEIVISEAKRLSRKYCIFSVPLEPYFSIGNLLLGRNIRRYYREHLWNWSLRQFNLLLLNHFDKVKVKIAFPWMIALCEV